MTEPVREPPPPATTHEALEPDAELERRNMVFGWALFGLFWLLFAGTVGVAFVYLALSN